jgi:hypothetical protein
VILLTVIETKCANSFFSLTGHQLDPNNAYFASKEIEAKENSTKELLEVYSKQLQENVKISFLFFSFFFFWSKLDFNVDEYFFSFFRGWNVMSKLNMELMLVKLSPKWFSPTKLRHLS